MEKPKRSRSANWDLQEKLLLKECIKENINIIESKSCDTNTNKQKQEAWMKVLRRFNELNVKQRGLEEIKQQWRSAKLEAKKCASVYKKSLRQTGGGQKPPSPPPDVQDIMNMIPHEFTEDMNKYDSDNVLFIVEEEKPSLPLDNITFNASTPKRPHVATRTIDFKESAIEGFNDTVNNYIDNNQVTLEAGSRRQTYYHDTRDNILGPDKTNNNYSIDNQVTLEAGSSRQTDHVTKDKIWPDKTNNITLERQPGASKRKCPDFKVRNIGKNNEEFGKSRDMVLIECLREEHKLKVKQMTEAHQWAKEEHELKIQHLKLQITILENEIKEINTVV